MYLPMNLLAMYLHWPYSSCKSWNGNFCTQKTITSKRFGGRLEYQIFKCVGDTLTWIWSINMNLNRINCLENASNTILGCFINLNNQSLAQSILLLIFWISNQDAWLNGFHLPNMPVSFCPPLHKKTFSPSFIWKRLPHWRDLENHHLKVTQTTDKSLKKQVSSHQVQSLKSIPVMEPWTSTSSLPRNSSPALKGRKPVWTNLSILCICRSLAIASWRQMGKFMWIYLWLDWILLINTAVTISLNWTLIIKITSLSDGIRHQWRQRTWIGRCLIWWERRLDWWGGYWRSCSLMLSSTSSHQTMHLSLVNAVI